MAYNDSRIFAFEFGCDAVPVDTEFIWPGFAPGGSDALEVRLVAAGPCRLVNAYYTALIVPGGIVVDTYTFYIDGVTSGESFDVGPAAANATYTGALDIAAGEGLSIYFSTTGATAADDITINCVFQRFQ